MSVIIEIPERQYTELTGHLLPADMQEEESAFLFADVVEQDGDTVFKYKDMLKATYKDYDYKSAYHIELSDEFRSRLIKKAHDLNASIIEFHSHIDQKYARFSASDWSGFEEFVPHLFWRLKNRPYAAVVFSYDTFDAFTWIENPKTPITLNYIKVGEKKYYPTQLSYKKWINE